jgi:hypothetical protein
MDLSLSLETQSNLSQDHQEAVWAFAQKRGRTSRAAEHHSKHVPSLRGGAQAILSDSSLYRATGDGESEHNIRRRRKMLSLKLPQMA